MTSPARARPAAWPSWCAMAAPWQSTRPASPASAPATDAGNLIHLKGVWGGHRLHIASIYLPNEAPRQTNFIEQHLRPLRASLPADTKLVWGGDLTLSPTSPWTASPAVASSSAATHPNTGVQRAWERHLPDLLDVYRVRHPTTCTYTHFGPPPPRGWTASPSAGAAALRRLCQPARGQQQRARPATSSPTTASSTSPSRAAPAPPTRCPPARPGACPPPSGGCGWDLQKTPTSWAAPAVDSGARGAGAHGRCCAAGLVAHPQTGAGPALL